MRPFTQLKATAIPYGQPDIDTDQIIPKQFLKTIEKSGLGKFLFFDQRFDAEGKENKQFILNQPPFREGGVLIAGANFGCGSSREHAPWALLDFGIRCVIAPSFADIFHENCIKNGILPVVLPADVCAALCDKAEKQPGTTLAIDLEAQTILLGNESISFEIEPFAKNCLLKGLDEIALTLESAPKIAAFEQKRAQNASWL